VGVDDRAWLKSINELEKFQETSGQFYYATTGKYYKIPAFDRLAWGNIFPPTYSLYPKETVSASILFYVPKGMYDLVHVEVHIPTTAKQDSVELAFLVDHEKIKTKYFRIDKNGNRKDEIIEQAAIDSLHIQDTQSRKQLSLWRGASQTVAK
jgi:hypothetical protein